MDLDLLATLADARPQYQIVIVGPVVKIDPATLPRRPNLHFLGGKTYDDLPAYLAGWDVALMPFALNEATRFISPTKTLEYLAAHKPVVSTAVRDVVTPYGDRNLVRIADASTFPAAVDAALAEDATLRATRCEEVLAQTSWDKTFNAMWAQVLGAAARPAALARPARHAQSTREAFPCSTT
jgi:UDP-galactopyranose mutase